MAQIKKDTSLRKAILQAAITGQLSSDIGGESLPLARTSLLTTPSPRGSAPKTPTETGKQLLDRIIEERNAKALADWNEALKTNPRAKKPAPIVATEIDEDEISFEIPENWCWCRLGDVAFVTKLAGFEYSSHIAPNLVPEGIPLFKGKNIQNGHLVLDFENYIPKEISDELDRSKLTKKCLLTPYVGTIGNIAIFDGTFEAHLGSNVGKIELIGEFILEEFLLYFFRSDTGLKQLSKHKKATAQESISIESIRDCFLPLPPLSVQNAIVAKLEQVLPLVDAYENAVLQKEELKSTLSDKVKKAILQEAITGKLTEQWRKQKAVVEPAVPEQCRRVETTESGEQLLARIIKERNAKALAEWEEKEKSNPKAKKPVPIVASGIEEEEIPFEIPESWCWCHLGEICNEIKRGKSPKYVDRSDYLAFAQKCNVKTGGIDLGLALYLDEKSIERYSEEDNLIQGDVVINSTGGGTMGRVGYYETKVPDGIKGVYPDSHVTVIRSIGKINQRYLYYVLKHNQPILEDCGTGSTNQTELKPGVLSNFVVPLPPLEEQEEIVKKVEELLTLCK